MRISKKNVVSCCSAIVASVALLALPVQAKPEDAKINLSALDSTPVQRYIVGFGTATRGNSAAAKAAIADVAQGQGLGLQLLRQLATGGHLVEVDSALPEQAAIAVMRAFARRSDVDYVEPDVLMRPVKTPIDPRYNEQWHYYEATAGMNLPGAWDKATGGGVVVAIVDTGQTDHPDLDDQTLPGYDFISS